MTELFKTILWVLGFTVVFSVLFSLIKSVKPSISKPFEELGKRVKRKNLFSGIYFVVVVILATVVKEGLNLGHIGFAFIIGFFVCLKDLIFPMNRNINKKTKKGKKRK